MEPQPPSPFDDIPYDSLERIFMRMDLEHIIKLSVNRDSLRGHARYYLRNFFEDKSITLKPIGTDGTISEYQTVITITGSRLCLAFVRCFGDQIQGQMCVNYLHVNPNVERCLDAYIGRYCGQSLTEGIQLNRKSRFYFETPLYNVRFVEAINCNIQNDFPRFAEWFPQMRNLHLVNCAINGPALNLTFSNLIDLHINIAGAGGEAFNIDDLSRLMQANPQITSLGVWEHEAIPFAEILNVVAPNQLLRKLCLFVEMPEMAVISPRDIAD